MEKYTSMLKKLNLINVNKGMKVNLNNMNEMAKLLDNPEKSTQFIHVAGTNGKGSVTLKLQKALQNSGFKSGIYTSPHLFSFRERIQINNEKIDQEIMMSMLETFFKIAEQHKIQLTFFEYITTLAFQYFKEQKVDVAVLETGIGGLLDATNIIQNNLAAVITSIALDHMGSLGYTIQEIAQKKAGIIKPNCPVIIGPNAIPYEIFEEKARQSQSPFYIVKGNEKSLIDYNEENNLTVYKTLQVLQKTYPQMQYLSPENIAFGISQQQMCRLEPLQDDLMINLQQKSQKKFKLFFDVGHNPNGLEKTFQRVKSMYSNNKIKVIFGTSSQKECFDSLATVSQYCDKCYLIQADHFRAMNIQNVIESSEQLKNVNVNWSNQVQPVIGNGNIKQTLDYFFNIKEIGAHNLQEQQPILTMGDISQQIENEDVVLVIGSFFLMREARTYFGYNDEYDPMELNERKIPIGSYIGFDQGQQVVNAI